MKEFIEVPASKNSLAQRKLVCGVGTNDADYKIKVGRNQCPFYTKWINMLKRCYYSKYAERFPAYEGCLVSDDWLVFSNFKVWMLSQNWINKELDKDILVPGNKIYSEYTCIFVPKYVNRLLEDHYRARGTHPQGVSFDKKSSRYEAYCSVKGRKKTLGRYMTPEEASRVYNVFKSEEIKKVALMQTDIRIQNGLLRHAELRLNA